MKWTKEDESQLLNLTTQMNTKDAINKYHLLSFRTKKSIKSKLYRLISKIKDKKQKTKNNMDLWLDNEDIFLKKCILNNHSIDKIIEEFNLTSNRTFESIRCRMDYISKFNSEINTHLKKIHSKYKDTYQKIRSYNKEEKDFIIKNKNLTSNDLYIKFNEKFDLRRSVAGLNAKRNQLTHTHKFTKNLNDKLIKTIQNSTTIHHGVLKFQKKYNKFSISKIKRQFEMINNLEDVKYVPKKKKAKKKKTKLTSFTNELTKELITFISINKSKHAGCLFFIKKYPEFGLSRVKRYYDKIKNIPETIGDKHTAFNTIYKTTIKNSKKKILIKFLMSLDIETKRNIIKNLI